MARDVQAILREQELATSRETLGPLLRFLAANGGWSGEVSELAPLVRKHAGSKRVADRLPEDDDPEAMAAALRHCRPALRQRNWVIAPKDIDRGGTVSFSHRPAGYRAPSQRGWIQ